MKCPECSKQEVIQTAKGKVCANCGLVVEDRSFFSGKKLLI